MIAQLWWPGGLVCLGPMGCDNQRGSSWETTCPRARSARLSEEDAYLLVQELWPGRQASGLAHLLNLPEGLSRDTGQWTQSLCFLVDSLLPTGVFQKGAHTLVWCLGFCGCCQQAALHSLALMTSMAYVHGSHRTQPMEKLFLNSYHPLDEEETTVLVAQSFRKEVCWLTLIATA